MENITEFREIQLGENVRYLVAGGDNYSYAMQLMESIGKVDSEAKIVIVEVPVMEFANEAFYVTARDLAKEGEVLVISGPTMVSLDEAEYAGRIELPMTINSVKIGEMVILSDEGFLAIPTISTKNWDKEVLRKMIDELLEIADSVSNGLSIDELRRESLIKVISDGISRGYIEEMNNMRSNLSNNNYTMDELRERLISLRKQNDLLESKLKGVELDGEALREKVIKELGYIYKNKMIKSIEGQGSRLAIFTEHVYAQTKDRRMFDIGEIKATIDLSNSSVRFYAMDEENKRLGFWSGGEGTCHPHVNTVGDPCLGDADVQIMEMVSQNEIAGVVMVMLNYLQSINISDIAGRGCIAWDEVDPVTKDVIFKGCDYREHSSELDDFFGVVYHRETNGDGYFDADIHDPDGDMDNENTIVCCECGGRYHEEDTTYVNGPDDYVCDSCLNSHYTWCDYCDTYVHVDDYDSDVEVCVNCRDEDFSYCSKCEQYHHEDDYDYDVEMCIECRSEYYTYCEECEEYVLNEDYNEVRDMCDDCVNIRTREERDEQERTQIRQAPNEPVQEETIQFQSMGPACEICGSFEDVQLYIDTDNQLSQRCATHRGER